jgi:acyl-CoA reductase-like NAD-dependent aldehyde dehydrogenase
MSCQSIDPNTGKVLKSFEHLSAAQLEKSIATAQGCFETWKQTSYADRAAVLSRAAVLLRARVDDFARLETLEMGKRIDEARFEVNFSADIETMKRGRTADLLRAAARAAFRARPGDGRAIEPGGTGRLLRDPAGLDPDEPRAAPVETRVDARAGAVKGSGLPVAA